MNASQAWLLVADDPALAGLADVARGVASQVTALVVGRRSVAEAAAVVADRVIWLGEPSAVPVEAYGPAVADVVAAAAPVAVVGATTPGGRALLGAVAARLQVPVLSAVASVEANDGRVVVRRSAFAGIAERTVAVDGGPAVLAVEAGAEPSGTAVAEIEQVAVTPLANAAVTQVRPKEKSKVDLAAAKSVVGVGRGLKSAADLAIVEDLATAVGGEVACSRPLAEGVDWLPKERYLGISGQTIAPDLYIAVGISGQLQHMVGVRGAKLIVAVNSDKNAPVFSQCDYGIVGDLYQVVPAIAAAVREQA